VNPNISAQRPAGRIVPPHPSDSEYIRSIRPGSISSDLHEINNQHPLKKRPTNVTSKRDGRERERVSVKYPGSPMVGIFGHIRRLVV
jgi:hypothetical protein